MSFYGLSVKDKDGNDVSMSKYQAKVLLIVNTATGCGFTPQYEGLQKLYEKYSARGFVILDFPCNQFGGQAPGTMKDISDFCTLKYNTTFPMFQKIDVNGQNESPLFTYLKKHKGGLFGSNIKWNFTKFLIDQKGVVIKRYASQDKPEDIEKDIVRLLGV